MSWRRILAERIDEFENLRGTSPFEEILVLAWLIGEVENGGLIQYLDNATGNDFYRARNATERVGSADVVALMDKVAAMFPGGVVPREQGDRMSVTEALSEKLEGDDPFDALTRRFWVVQPALEASMDRWLEANATS